MGYPINADLLRRINQEAFYSEIDAAANERIYPKIAEMINQEVTSVIRPGLGAIPKPIQLSGTTGGSNAPRVKQLKDYVFTTSVVEWDLTVEMPRSVVEDLPDEASRIGRMHGSASQVFFDERLVQQLDSTTALGYDGKALFSTTHGESGTSQDNAHTVAAGTGTIPTVAELQAQLALDLVGLRGYTDDQGRPANEGVGQFLILIPPAFEWVYKTVLDPSMAAQSVDSSGALGQFRGMFETVVSAYVPADRHFIFAKSRTRRAIGLFTKTPWDYKSNIGSDSDAWNFGRMAMFSGYARFELFPWDWKTAVRNVWT
jgi:hypothetical protein